MFRNMKYFRYSLLLIPVLFTVFALRGCGFFYRAGVSASCAIIVWIVLRQFAGKGKWFLIAALLTSICGDWFMSHTGGNPVRFIYGVCLFFVAHLGFVVFCLKNGHVNRYVLSIMLTGFLAFFFLALRPALTQPALFAAVLAYLLVSCFSFAVATGLHLATATRVCFSFGIALLVFSDTIIALKDFVGHKELGFLILPTYFASHIVIALAMILEKKRKNTVSLP